MRKHVKPTHRLAAIPDPVRGGDIPPEGLTVEWSVHWARLAQRGDIVVTELDEDDEAVKAKKAAPKREKATPAAPTPSRRAKPTGKATPGKPKAPAPLPTGQAPPESGPQVEEPEAAPPATPATSEAPVT